MRNTLAVGSVQVSYFQSPHPVPDLDPETALLSLIASAKVSIHLALYSLTVKDLADELVAAHQRGVEVRGVFDRRQSEYKFSKVSSLQAAGIDARLWHVGAGSEMHDKVAIFDGSTVTMGSYNWTGLAEKTNIEVMVQLSGNASMVQEFEQQVEAAYSQAK